MSVSGMNFLKRLLVSLFRGKGLKDTGIYKDYEYTHIIIILSKSNILIDNSVRSVAYVSSLCKENISNMINKFMGQLEIKSAYFGLESILLLEQNKINE